MVVTVGDATRPLRGTFRSESKSAHAEIALAAGDLLPATSTDLPLFVHLCYSAIPLKTIAEGNNPRGDEHEDTGVISESGTSISH